MGISNRSNSLSWSGSGNYIFICSQFSNCILRGITLLKMINNDIMLLTEIFLNDCALSIYKFFLNTYSFQINLQNFESLTST